jgi:hypothetical protein
MRVRRYSCARRGEARRCQASGAMQYRGTRARDVPSRFLPQPLRPHRSRTHRHHRTTVIINSSSPPTRTHRSQCCAIAVVALRRPSVAMIRIEGHGNTVRSAASATKGVFAARSATDAGWCG